MLCDRWRVIFSLGLSKVCCNLLKWSRKFKAFSCTSHIIIDAGSDIGMKLPDSLGECI